MSAISPSVFLAGLGVRDNVLIDSFIIFDDGQRRLRQKWFAVNLSMTAYVNFASFDGVTMDSLPGNSAPPANVRQCPVAGEQVRQNIGFDRERAAKKGR
jgi:hypothetical protein